MQKEIHMYFKAARGAHSALGALAIVGALFGGNVAAREYDVKVAIHVSTQGLDLKQPAGMQEFYERLEHAAHVACTYGNRVDLKPASDPIGCYETALGDAIRSVNLPLLTDVYLETHTLRQAAAHGIQVPAQVAAKR
jgi:UrcA family protein